MTYLFTYIYSGKRNGESVSGQGSVKIIATGINKITESTIYGENGAINIVKDMLSRDHNMANIDVSPMGWFKFDEDSSVHEATAEQFAKWVATEIFDDNWEYNKDAFDELACRKLAKLGIVVRMGDEWELVESEESEEV